MFFPFKDFKTFGTGWKKYPSSSTGRLLISSTPNCPQAPFDIKFYDIIL